jgi:DNA polymerase-3 subunit chi
MTRIDFYILPPSIDNTGSALAVVCKLCKKASASGSRVYVRTPERALAEDIGIALWSFEQGGFLSHEHFSGTPPEEPLPVVLIGEQEPPPSHHGILMNLGDDVPLYFSRFERVLEIVPGSPEHRASSRTRYKFYKDRGYELGTHNL